MDRPGTKVDDVAKSEMLDDSVLDHKNTEELRFRKNDRRSLGDDYEWSPEDIAPLFWNASTIGEYLKNNTAPPGYKVEDVQNFIKALFDEIDALLKMKTFDGRTCEVALDKAYDACNAKKDRLIHEMAAEDLLEVTVAAAETALVVTSWCWFATCGIAVSGAAALVTEKILEANIVNLQKSIMSDIDDMGHKALMDPALAELKVYLDAQTNTTILQAKMNLGGDKTILRSFFLGVAKASKSYDNFVANMIKFHEQYDPNSVKKWFPLFDPSGDFDQPKLKEAIAELKGLSTSYEVISAVNRAFLFSGILAQNRVLKYSTKIRTLWSMVDKDIGAEYDVLDTPDFMDQSVRAAKYVKFAAVLGVALEAIAIGLKVAQQANVVNQISDHMNSARDLFKQYFEKIKNTFNPSKKK